jgi:polyribonucleotide nucleotidyltransferase
LRLTVAPAALVFCAGGGGGRLSDEPPEVGSIHKGEVKRIEAYGVFVALPGFRKYGLVHASQVGLVLQAPRGGVRWSVCVCNDRWWGNTARV